MEPKTTPPAILLFRIGSIRVKHQPKADDYQGIQLQPGTNNIVIHGVTIDGPSIGISDSSLNREDGCQDLILANNIIGSGGLPVVNATGSGRSKDIIIANNVIQNTAQGALKLALSGKSII